MKMKQRPDIQISFNLLASNLNINEPPSLFSHLQVGTVSFSWLVVISQYLRPLIFQSMQYFLVSFPVLVYLSIPVTHFVELQGSEFCWPRNMEIMYQMQIKTITTWPQLVELSKIRIFLQFLPSDYLNEPFCFIVDTKQQR